MSDKWVHVQRAETRERNARKRAEQDRKVEERAQRLNAGRS